MAPGSLVASRLVAWLVGCLIGLLVVRCFGQLFVWLLGWFVARMPGRSVGWMAVRLGGVVWLAGLVGWFGWLAGLNPPTPGPKPRGPHREGSGRGPREPDAWKEGFAFAYT